MAHSAKSQCVYTVKTLKEILMEARSWESAEKDFVGICECIEETLKDKKNSGDIKTYFKRLDTQWKKVSSGDKYQQVKTLLCNPSYLSKHHKLQRQALQDVGYNSKPLVTESACDSYTASLETPETPKSEIHQPVLKVADMIEELTNELEKEKKRTADLEDKTNVLTKEKVEREREVKQLEDKVLSVSTMIDTFNNQLIEVACVPKKKKKKMAKKLASQFWSFPADAEMTSSNVIKYTIHTLSGIQNTLPKLQETMECLKTLHGMETLISSTNQAITSENEDKPQPDSTTSKQDSLLATSNKMRECMEGICKELFKQQKESSGWKDCVQRLQEENKKIDAKLQQIEQKHTNHEQGMEVLSELKQQLQNDKTTIQEKEEQQQSYTKEIQQLKGEIAQMEETIQQLTQRNETPSESHTTEVEQLKGEITKLEGTIHQLRKQNQALSESRDQNIKVLSQLEQQREDDKKSILEKDESQQMYNKEIQRLKEEATNSHTTICRLRQENEILMERYETDMTALKADFQKMKGKMSEEIKQLKSRNEELLNRLSKQAEMRLTDGNHTITDLSDPNRPTSLAEKFSELYDNEWTEAFEEVLENSSTAMTEKSAISFLLNILSVTSDFCSRHADTQWKEILNAICQQSTDQVPQIPQVYAKDLRDVRKLTGNNSSEGVIKRFFESDITHLDLQPDEIGPNLELYTRKCLELSWLMSIQNPPLFFYQKVHQGDSFDEDYFRFYTSAGTVVDFLVWPALLSCENGDLLRKGVCQGLKKKK